ncbi:MAG: hypothetical protein IPM18_01430 [Phycisphaerales bacterium]|nr:hypothetical protein [Phycisphaerales bacterium]
MVIKSAGSDDAPAVRLKRFFLKGLVWSLASCALLAVFLLLLGEFNDFTGRVLGTLLALAVHSGLALACAAGLERNLWPALNRLALGLFAAAFALYIGCLWWPYASWERSFQAAGTTLLLVAAYIVAIPGATLVDQGRDRQLGVAALVAAGLAAALSITCIWGEDVDAIWFAKLTAIVCLTAFTLAETCLLVRVPHGGLTGVLRIATGAAAWLLLGFIALMIVTETVEELPFRIAGSLGVINATGAIALLILLRLRRVERGDQLATVPAELDLICPRCTAPQHVSTGDSRCSACGLGFRIEVEEPRCRKCDYLLWKLPERRCPECGTEF